MSTTLQLLKNGNNLCHSDDYQIKEINQRWLYSI